MVSEGQSSSGDFQNLLWNRNQTQVCGQLFAALFQPIDAIIIGMKPPAILPSYQPCEVGEHALLPFLLSLATVARE